MSTEVTAASDAESTYLASEPVVIAIGFSGWIVLGLGVGALAARLGHDRRTWLGLGAALGPLTLALLLLYRSQRHRLPARVLDRGEPGPGSVSVLIAVLGAPQDAAEVAPLLRAHGDRLGHVILCRAVRPESLADPRHTPDEADAQAALDAAGVFLGDIHASKVLLPEPAAATVPDRAIRDGVDHVIVLGDPRVQRAVIDHPGMRTRSMTVSSPVTSTS